MKSIFALMMGTIALLLAVTAQDLLSARILFAAVGLALYAVALSPGVDQGGPIATWHRKPSKLELGEFSDRPR